MDRYSYYVTKSPFQIFQTRQGSLIISIAIGTKHPTSIEDRNMRKIITVKSLNFLISISSQIAAD